MDSLDIYTIQMKSKQSNVSFFKSELLKMVYITHFLNKNERDALFFASCKENEAFQRPEGPGSNVGTTRYLSLEPEGVYGALTDSFQSAIDYLRKRIMEKLPILFSELEVEPFDVKEIPLTFMNGLDGHNGIPHMDSIDGRLKISLLYYFNKVPKVFQGGDLEFYASDVASQTGHCKEPHTKIDLEDNLLLAFPSQTFHGVTTVQCDSIDLEDGRFVAVGFIGPQ